MATRQWPERLAHSPLADAPAPPRPIAPARRPGAPGLYLRAAMPTSFPLVYTWPLMHRATLAYCWRVTGWRWVLAVALLAAATVGRVLEGDRSWPLGAFAV